MPRSPKPRLCQFSPATTLQECGASIFTTTADDVDAISAFRAARQPIASTA